MAEVTREGDEDRRDRPPPKGTYQDWDVPNPPMPRSSKVIPASPSWNRKFQALTAPDVKWNKPSDLIDTDPRKLRMLGDTQKMALALDDKRAASDALKGKAATKPAAQPALPTQAPQRTMPPLPESFKSWGQDTQNYMALIGILAGLAGAVSRNHATTALNALGSGLQGMREGQKEQADHDYKVWQAATRDVLAQNKLARDQYDKVLRDKKLTYEQKMQELKVLSSQHQDDITYKAASIGDMRQLDMAMRQREMLGNQVETAFDRIEQHKAELDNYVANHQQRVAEISPTERGGGYTLEDTPFKPEMRRRGTDLRGEDPLNSGVVPSPPSGSGQLPMMNLFDVPGPGPYPTPRPPPPDAEDVAQADLPAPGAHEVSGKYVPGGSSKGKSSGSYHFERPPNLRRGMTAEDEREAEDPEEGEEGN